MSLGSPSRQTMASSNNTTKLENKMEQTTHGTIGISLHILANVLVAADEASQLRNYPISSSVINGTGPIPTPWDYSSGCSCIIFMNHFVGGV